MKNYKNFKTPNLQSAKVIVLSFLTLLAFSCQTEDIETSIEASNVALFEILDANTDGNSGKSSSARNGAPQKGDIPIAVIAIENGGFDELVDALIYVDEELDAGLVNLFLNGKDQYTVFAPTDNAFFALYEALDPDGSQGIDSIRDLPADLVLNVLLYHVTDGRRASNSVLPKKNSKTIDTLLGQSFSVNSSGMITAGSNDAMILAADISASNGIIHVISAVLLP
ncbi:putative surface protein with fasciclin (FAS1) repeats [Flavobacteriaceae bacterium MAR_2010_72]|nr:putative surface protein with fasciclin (FAS1) repeats [Flavobacteriaceae bacterium MAR_2010_72]TVZ58554.1 putative surface protein with fasciclin (FAS1) repeats [Flavobacteriaceae bacterium MAR_2010_105]